MEGKSREKRAKEAPAMRKPATTKMETVATMNVANLVSALCAVLARRVLSRRRDFNNRYRSILRNAAHFQGMAIGVAVIVGGRSFVGSGVVYTVGRGVNVGVGVMTCL